MYESIAASLTQDMKMKLREIQLEAKVPDDRFKKGIVFAALTVKGEPRTKAYMAAFGETLERAKSNASNLFRAKWVQKIYALFDLDEDVEFKPLKMKIIKKLTEDFDLAEEAKDRLEIAKVLATYLPKPGIKANKTQEEDTKTDPVLEAFESMMKKIESKSIEEAIVLK